MEPIIHPKILEGFGLDINTYSVEQFGSGLINHTFKLSAKKGLSGEDFILQRINTQVFKKPERIVRNHRTAANYLSKNSPGYYFLTPVQTVDGKDILEVDSEYWRMLPFVNHAVTINEAGTPRQAYEAARQFGCFTKNLSGINLELLQPTIPNFHNLTLRYNNFILSIANASAKRKTKAKNLIRSFQKYSGITTTYNKLKEDPNFPDRLIHHDTKINNVMFDPETFKGICVIDLDTIMPGKIISDLGDMVRTYVSPASEEETDFDKVTIRNDYYEALMRGYLSEIRSELTPAEKNALFYSGQFMIYMQGIRYLTDYLSGDVYYGADYPEHNYNRAKNQLALLDALNEKEKDLKLLIEKHL